MTPSILQRPTMASAPPSASVGPGLSVVIPTTGARPGLLRRAVESCLAVAPEKGVEVLVVTNGSERANEPAFDLPGQEVRFLHVSGRNANLARSAGMEAARGDFVRFLDDDDFLVPAGALAQYNSIQASCADVSTGSVRFEDESSLEIGSYVPLGSNDFVAELLWQRPSTLPVAHLFRRAFLEGLRWDPDRNYLQDVDWMHGMLRRGEVRWQRFPGTVGVWYHHRGPRTSIDVARHLGEEALRMNAAIVVGTIEVLAGQGRLEGERRRAAAKALWDFAHQGFSFSPRSWHALARAARRLDPMSRPRSPLFTRWPIRGMDPLVAEWLLFPARAMVRRAGI